MSEFHFLNTVFQFGEFTDIILKLPKIIVIEVFEVSTCGFIMFTFLLYLMQEILEEIAAEREKQAMLRDESVVETVQDDIGIVLVACKDEHSCVQLEECITSDPNKVFRVICFSSHLLFSSNFHSNWLASY